MKLKEILACPLCGNIVVSADRLSHLCAGKGSTEDRKRLQDKIYKMVNEVFRGLMTFPLVMSLVINKDFSMFYCFNHFFWEAICFV